jgi:hypothetical protein
MEDTYYQGFKLYDTIEKMVMKILTEQKVLNSTFLLGKVDQVISESKLRVFINGSTVAQLVNCNPDITFSVGDHVVIANLSRTSSHDKFVISRRIVK